MNNKAHLRPQDFDSNGDIIPMACKEENGDLISRSALIQHAYSAVVDGVEKDIIDLSDVDNAPTIPLPDFKEGYRQAIIDGKTNFSKPQGEWVKIGDIGLAYKCNKCGEVAVVPTNFCSNCGVPMKGGAV